MSKLIAVENSINPPSDKSAIILAWLIAGTLDILAAILILAKGNAAGVLRFVASGAFGSAAFTGGSGYIWFGLLAHYFIAFCFVAFYFLIYQFVPFLRKNFILSAIVYGLFAQVVMSFLVLPLTQIAHRPFNIVGFIENAVILMFTIGLPAAWMRQRVYRSDLTE
ncbi:DUF1440 domain-containing protein [Pedobacter sp. HMF7647]|uniref:DUF1440 domain-containing protein n=1 Tax=Hufsiella arboris TaxID=2695275 RepID=A0A7K1Y8V8_9SPHI|nr:DUF1440 domain-containing protein [Hufsiella arboris]MXV50509.1 DUF1440 domain-containing protein [Hufsiella arboris]